MKDGDAARLSVTAKSRNDEDDEGHQPFSATFLHSLLVC